MNRTISLLITAMLLALPGMATILEAQEMNETAKLSAKQQAARC